MQFFFAQKNRKQKLFLIENTKKGKNLFEKKHFNRIILKGRVVKNGLATNASHYTKTDTQRGIKRTWDRGMTGIVNKNLYFVNLFDQGCAKTINVF